MRDGSRFVSASVGTAPSPPGPRVHWVGSLGDELDADGTLRAPERASSVAQGCIEGCIEGGEVTLVPVGVLGGTVQELHGQPPRTSERTVD